MPGGGWGVGQSVDLDLAKVGLGNSFLHRTFGVCVRQNRTVIHQTENLYYGYDFSDAKLSLIMRVSVMNF